MYKFQEFVHDVASSKAPSSLKTYCGNAAVKGFGVGPDGWVQMVIQIAYASLTERFGGDNGPGRLGFFRVVSNENAAFVRAMLASTVRDAVKKHQQLAPESARGEDVDYLGSTVRSHPRCLDQKTVERPNFHPLFRYDAIHE
ncbi:hypothetical protein V8E55_012256 [Tylopilus felleus]